MEVDPRDLDAIPEHEASKVHFSTDVTPNTEIVVRPKDNESVDVHLGFLSIDHTYEVEFSVPNSVRVGSDLPLIQNPDTQVLSMTPTGLRNSEQFFPYLCQRLLEDGSSLTFVVEMKCRLEGKMKRVLKVDAADGKHLTVNVFAKVMAKHRGTPMLKNNIRCTHVDSDTMSDASDWQRF